MERLSGILSFIYRFLIIAIVIIVHYKAWTEVSRPIDHEVLIFYSVLIIYAVGFTLLRVSKWTAYGELIVVCGLIYYYEHNVLYLQLLLPFVNIASSKAKQLDIILTTVLFSSFLYVQHFTFETCLFVGFALYLTLNVFHLKFGQIELLQTTIFKLKKTIEKLNLEIGNKDSEIEITSSMFVHSKYLNETIEVDEIMNLMVNSAKDFFKASYACLYLKSEDGFYLEKESGKNDQFNIPEKISLAEANNVRIENKMIRMTIDYENEPWGIIAVYGKRRKMGDSEQYVFFPFQEEDFEVLSVYIKMAMSPIKHAKLLKKMNYLANNDFLTGIANRRYFVEQFNYLSKMAHRGQELSLLLLDVDHFKSFNDQYGHDVGDEVLKQVAETIKYTIREVDVVGRLGGEEFAVLLTGVGENAEFVANRIRQRVESIPFERKITVSIGIANYKQHGSSWEVLYKRADEALYYAKENGRNQVITYGPHIQ